MRGGARRKTLRSHLPPSQPHPVQNDINDNGNDHVQDDKQHRNQEHQQQRPTNDAGDGGNEYDEEDYQNYEDGDESGDEDVEGGDAGDSDEEVPKLAEGFYLIEAVRRKRIRKGETQYLIKWCGWPESTNTWEPAENLMSCADVIDAFEESMRSRKQGSRSGRKRKKSVAPILQSRKKQDLQHSAPAAATYDAPSVKLKIIEQPLSVCSAGNSNFTNGKEKTVNRRSLQSNDRRSLQLSPEIRESIEKNALDVQLTKPKVPYPKNQENMSDFAIHIQEERGVGPNEVGPATGNLKVDGTEHIRVSSRIGARRKKSCAVKRFKTTNATAKTTNANDMVGESENNNASPNIPVVINIIKALHYSTSTLDDTSHVFASFLVRRSDGEEVVVDNKYLKENNPILLINFYEEHLRYNPSE